MPICSICQEYYKYILPCNCKLCLSCLISWFEEKNQEKAIWELQCPLNCPYIYSREEIVNLCYKSGNLENQQNKIQAILLKEYLKEHDIRPCPKQGCQYFGFIPENTCMDELTCNACGYAWKDFSILPQHAKLEIQLQNAIKQSKNAIYCFFKTDNCPNCGILTSKTGGCPHMTCRSCHHQYCWTCKRRWQNHNRQTCNNQFFYLFMSFLFIIINLLWTLKVFSLFKYLWTPLLYLLFWIFVNFFIANNIFALVCFVIAITDMIRQTRTGIYWRLLYSFSSILLYLIAVIFNNYMEVHFYNYIQILLIEIVIAVGCAIAAFEKSRNYIGIPILFICALYISLQWTICVFISLLPILIGGKQNKNIGYSIHLLSYLYYGYEYYQDNIDRLTYIEVALHVLFLIVACRLKKYY